MYSLLLQVRLRPGQVCYVISEESDSSIAVAAQQATYLTSLVVMVDRPFTISIRTLSRETDRTSATLFGQKSIVLFLSEAILPKPLSMVLCDLFVAVILAPRDLVVVPAGPALSAIAGLGSLVLTKFCKRLPDATTRTSLHFGWLTFRAAQDLAPGYPSAAAPEYPSLRCHQAYALMSARVNVLVGVY